MIVQSFITLDPAYSASSSVTKQKRYSKIDTRSRVLDSSSWRARIFSNFPAKVVSRILGIMFWRRVSKKWLRVIREHLLSVAFMAYMHTGLEVTT